MQQIKFIFFCFFFIQPVFSQNYQLELHLSNGNVMNFPVADIRKITFDNVTDVEDAQGLQQIIKTFQVLQNYPNPFNPSTTIQYELPQNGKVEIRIYNITGQLVRKLLSEYQVAGTHEVKWEGRDDGGSKVASGMYIYQVIFEKERIARKMIMVR